MCGKCAANPEQCSKYQPPTDELPQIHIFYDSEGNVLLECNNTEIPLEDYEGISGHIIPEKYFQIIKTYFTTELFPSEEESFYAIKIEEEIKNNHIIRNLFRVASPMDNNECNKSCGSLPELTFCSDSDGNVTLECCGYKLTIDDYEKFTGKKFPEKYLQLEKDRMKGKIQEDYNTYFHEVYNEVSEALLTAYKEKCSDKVCSDKHNCCSSTGECSKEVKKDCHKNKIKGREINIIFADDISIVPDENDN